MRFLHTADWHLGRIFHGLRLTEEQSYLLDQLIELTKAEKTEAVIIAGDIYDRGVPPEDAVRLFDEVLCRLVKEAGQKVILIAGNHDNPARLGFGQILLAGENVFITSPLSATTSPIVLQDQYGPVYFAPFSYGDPLAARTIFRNEAIRSHEDVLCTQINCMLPQIPPKARSIAIAHVFLAGAQASPDSERPLAIGGTTSVSPALFSPFSYTALGHLHMHQTWGESMAYAGSLMKYSFNETAQKKGVFIIELGANKVEALQSVPLTARHDLKQLRGSFAELMAGENSELKEAFLQITLTDATPILDAKARLEQRYPHILHLQYERLLHQPESIAHRSQRKLSYLELTTAFFEQVGEGPLSAEQRDLLAQAITEVEKGGCQ